MKEQTEYCINAELQFARAKFPKNVSQFSALIEEVGELAKALLEHERGESPEHDVYAEAIQVASMAIRVAEEGSAEFPYSYKHSHYKKFNVNKKL